MSPKKESAKPAEAEPAFEDGMAELEDVVGRLEQGDLPLEDSLAAFEKGVGLLRVLHSRLGDVEKRVEVLVRDSEGVLRREPMETEE